MTLLQKAKQVKLRTLTRDSITEEDYELAMAWARDEVSITQVAKAMGKYDAQNGKAGPIMYRFAITFKKMIQEGKLK